MSALSQSLQKEASAKNDKLVTLVARTKHTDVLRRKTSSSAVAKRPRGASCLSVVSFNSTKRRVESFIVSCVGYRFTTACS